MAKIPNEVVIEKVTRLLEKKDVVEIIRENGVEEIGFGAWRELDYDGTGSITINFREKEPELKVGDYAKFVIEDPGTGGVKVGEIIKLTGTGNAFDFKFDVITDNRSSYTNVSNLTRATDEEIAAAKAKAEKEAEAAKWEKIGRKPGEYKKGDIVRGKHSASGDIIHGEIIRIGDSYDLCHAVTSFKDDGFRAVLKSSLELITPVESRFDLAMDGDQDSDK